MGMFDTIICEYPLPIEKQKDVWFQTKDLENCLHTYTIKQDGTLWLKGPTSKQDDDFFGQREEFKDFFIDFSGTIEFYGFLDNKDFATFEAYFILGHLKDIALKQREKTTGDWNEL